MLDQRLFRPANGKKSTFGLLADENSQLVETTVNFTRLAVTLGEVVGRDMLF